MKKLLLVVLFVPLVSIGQTTEASEILESGIQKVFDDKFDEALIDFNLAIEKDLNGSVKHNNWSLNTNTGVNLLKPGKNPKSNLRFLTFFVNTIMAIRKNADILRASIAGAGNDHRLGANEAPPAIISVFIGSQLSKLLDDLEKNIKAGKLTPADKTALKLEIGRIPEVLFDNTDRNRT